jgi:hypothetical protein
MIILERPKHDLIALLNISDHFIIDSFSNINNKNEPVLLGSKHPMSIQTRVGPSNQVQMEIDFKLVIYEV